MNALKMMGNAMFTWLINNSNLERMHRNTVLCVLRAGGIQTASQEAVEQFCVDLI